MNQGISAEVCVYSLHHGVRVTGLRPVTELFHICIVVRLFLLAGVCGIVSCEITELIAQGMRCDAAASGSGSFRDRDHRDGIDAFFKLFCAEKTAVPVNCHLDLRIQF